MAGPDDPRSVEQLLQDYLPRLRAFVRVRMGEELRRRETDSDLVQSVCRQLLTQEQARFEAEAQFRAWLFTSALNKIREKHRFHHMEKRDPAREAGNADSFLELGRGYATVSTPSAAAMAREEVEALEAALDTLSEDQREVIALSRIAGLPHDVVAERMGRSIGAVRKLLGRALQQLARTMR